MQIIDLSRALENDVPADPPGLGPVIDDSDHTQGAIETCQFFPGLVPSDLPDGEGWAVEKISLTTHCGTHIDAPYHFASTMNKGERAWTIDEVPLDWCIRPGVKLDFRHFPDGYVATADDIRAELARIGYTLRPFDIVLVNTAAAAAYGQPHYLATGCGIGRDATLWLMEQGVRITGTDAWSWDAPFIHTRSKYLATGDAALIWEGHKAGREGIYLHIEKLANLDRLPPFGFTVHCLPVKIAKASAGWCRAVAIIN